MKKESIIHSPQSDPLEISLPSFTDTQSRVFTEHKGKIYIGTEEVRPELLVALKDQARNIKTMELYEIFMSTIKNEAANLALHQSKDWESVQFAKALWHTQHVLENIITVLTK